MVAPIDMFDIGVHTCIGEIKDIPAADKVLVRITNKMILKYAVKYQPPPASPSPGLYQLTGIVTSITGQTLSCWHVGDFAYQVTSGKVTGILFNVYNDAPAVGGHKMTVRLNAQFPHSIKR